MGTPTRGVCCPSRFLRDRERVEEGSIGSELEAVRVGETGRLANSANVRSVLRELRIDR